MRPDCSLKVEWLDRLAAKPEPVWVHFDAKYRVDAITDIMAPATDEVTAIAAADQEDEEETQGRAKRDDLLKMHAYRDAIRRSAGAYVVYPGTISDLLPEYQELLPGLGAFPLKPSEAGTTTGASSIRRFILDVLDHFATQASQHERGRYWEHESYRPTTNVKSHVPGYATFLTSPPADSPVLLGFVRDEEHFAWIRRERRYNLRADARTGAVGMSSRALSADYAVLYSPAFELAEIWSISGEPEIWRLEQMLERGYPAPRGATYLCMPLGCECSDAVHPTFSLAHILEVRRLISPTSVWGAPVCVSWADLLGPR